MSRRRLLRWTLRLLLAGAIVLLVYRWTRPEEVRVPITGREPNVSLTQTEQRHVGALVFDRTVADAGTAVLEAGPDVERLRRVVEPLIGVAGRDKPDYEWQWALVGDPRADAFCLPDGRLVVYDGLLRAARSDAALVFVLAHAMAHAVAEHGAERILRGGATADAKRAAQIEDDAPETGVIPRPPGYRRIATLVGAGIAVGERRPWSSRHELEAQRIALVYAARTGYHPREVLRAWEAMRSGRDTRPASFLASHPGGRTATLRRWFAEAVDEYERRDDTPINR